MSNLVNRIKVPLYQTQIDRVTESISKGELVNGRALDELEDRLKKKFNRQYALLTSNGFSAIFLTLVAIDAKEKEVILPAISTCFSMVNAVKMAGYKIKFCDVDVESMGLYGIEDNNSIVLSPNHFGKIASFNKEKSEVFTIEDSCQSFFSSQNSKNSKEVTILSFYPSKLINGIDGGAILTDSRELYEKVKERVYYSGQKNFEESGAFNFRLNNINASFALATMEHLDDIEQRLKEIYKVLTYELKEKGIKFLEMGRDEVPSKLILLFSNKKDRDREFDAFIKNGIEVSLELIFIAPNIEHSSYTNATTLVNNTLSIPFHPLLTSDEILKMTNHIKDL
jgi:dTDP-4-amino-4,6-dideoxygalactose transaminase